MKSGKEILLGAYWGNKGWKDGTITQEDFLKAKSDGYMFDYPKAISHEETIYHLRKILSKINKEDVSNAFLYSLSTRKLEYRSALGSYYYAIGIPKHDIVRGTSENQNHCYLCGWYKWEQNPNDYDLKLGINVYNFERIKFCGVRHDYLDYVLFDLAQFIKLPKVTPTKEDREILYKILNCVSRLEATNKAEKLKDIIAKEKILKSNKDEIGVILNILGITGILSSKDYPCYEEKFVSINERGPEEYKNDFSYPVNRWRAKNGINETRFKRVFSYDYILKDI